MIETYGYARAGLLGNPSDGYFGKTISFAMSNFRARVLLYPSGRLEIKPSKADLPIFENLDDLYRTTGGAATMAGFASSGIDCAVDGLLPRGGIELEDRNFTLEYESNIPQRLGLGGSSAIVTAALRALCQYFGLEIPLPVQAISCWNRDAGVGRAGRPAGPRGASLSGACLHGLFARPHGVARLRRIRALDPDLLPLNMWPTGLPERRHGGVHNSIRERWNRGEPEVVEAMRTWAGCASGKTCLLERDYGPLGE